MLFVLFALSTERIMLCFFIMEFWVNDGSIYGDDITIPPLLSGQQGKKRKKSLIKV